MTPPRPSGTRRVVTKLAGGLGRGRAAGGPGSGPVTAPGTEPGTGGRNGRLRAPRVSTPVDGAGRTLSGVVAHNEYGGYFVPHSSLHRPAAQRVLAGEVWEKATIRYLASTWDHGDIVHAGTYFGDFLPALAEACPPSSRIWAFEPNPENFRCAQVTAIINDCADVHITNAALGERESTSQMAVRDARGRGLGGASRIVDPETVDREAGTAASVRVVSVDEVVPADRHVSIIQLDVEGHEGPALRGAMSTIERCRPTLVLETVPKGDPEVMERLAALDYRAVEQVNHNTVFVAGS
jgi:FkbM family methyltransferase